MCQMTKKMTSSVEDLHLFRLGFRYIHILCI